MLVVAAAGLVALTLAGVLQASVASIRNFLAASGDIVALDRWATQLQRLSAQAVDGSVSTAASLDQLRVAHGRLLEAGRAVDAKKDLDPGLPPLMDAHGAYAAAVDRMILAVGDGDASRMSVEGASVQAAFVRLDEAVREVQGSLLQREISALRMNQVQMLAALLFGALASSAISLRAFTSLERSEERFRAFAEHVSDPLWVVEPGGRIIYSTPSVLSTVGTSGSEAGANFFDAVHPEDLERARAFVSYLISQPGELHTFEGRFRGGDAGEPELEVTGHNLTNNPSVRGIVLNARDVTQRRKYEALLRREALHDSLTQLPNRVLLMDRISTALAACGHDRTLTFAVIYIDLDGFKTINDTMGHAVGDELLAAVAARLSDTLRILGRPRPQLTSGPRRAPGTDTLARVGGDEFVVLLNHTRNAPNALQAATRLLSEIKRPFEVAGRELNITASLGVTTGPDDYTSVDALLRDADAAMYRAKASGRSQVRMFDSSMEASATRTLVLRGQIRDAIERKEFVLRYQPVVSLETRKLHGCEALVRWSGTGSNLIPPADFMPMAEESGLIVPLGRWVILEASKQARAWRSEFPNLPPGLVIVNVSSKELADADFITSIDRVVATSGVDPADLKLELTEGMAMQDPANTLAVIRQLRSRGHKVTMDDFGTGHSLLSWFQQLPIDGFKIDQSFVRDIETSARSLNVVRLMVDMAKTAGIEVIAEGVETERQASLLRELGCTLAQGYLFAKALEADELRDTFLTKNA